MLRRIVGRTQGCHSRGGVDGRAEPLLGGAPEERAKNPLLFGVSKTQVLRRDTQPDGRGNRQGSSIVRRGTTGPVGLRSPRRSGRTDERRMSTRVKPLPGREVRGGASQARPPVDSTRRRVRRVRATRENASHAKPRLKVARRPREVSTLGSGKALDEVWKSARG